jgi:pimeloyl-ACP methyl ester carboxylesterase
MGVLVMILNGCASLPQEKVNAVLSDHSNLHKQAPSFQEFMKLGPFTYSAIESYFIRIAPNNTLNTDVFLTGTSSAAPLVIIQHGNKASKDVHRLQAEHLASWGFHVLTVEQPNEHQWIQNGHRIAELVQFLKSWPQVFPRAFNENQIILAGHSFGGSAVAIGGSLSPVMGVIFLDPALYSGEVSVYLRKLRKPIMLLAADRRLFYSRKRHQFFELTRGHATQIAVRNATHEDAQYPSLTESTYFFDPFTNDRNQTYFMAALTASAFSLAKQKNFNFAWDIMRTQQSRDKNSFFGFRRRTPDTKARRG